jgi:hypothetical protein
MLVNRDSQSSGRFVQYFLLQVTQKVDYRTCKITGVLPACADGPYYASDFSARSAEGGLHLCFWRAIPRWALQELLPNVKNVTPN